MADKTKLCIDCDHFSNEGRVTSCKNREVVQNALDQFNAPEVAVYGEVSPVQARSNPNLCGPKATYFDDTAKRAHRDFLRDMAIRAALPKPPPPPNFYQRVRSRIRDFVKSLMSTLKELCK